MLKRTPIAVLFALSAFALAVSADDEKEMSTKPLEDDAEAVVIQMKPGVTKRIPISRQLPNRIVTPFENPSFVSNVSGISYETIGRAIYVSVNTDEPIGGFIQGPGDHALSVLFVPESRPQQDVTLELAGYEQQREAPAAQRSQAAEHEKRMLDLMRQAVSGTTPRGFSASAFDGDQLFAGSILVTPDTVLTGADLVIEVYALVNEGADTTAVEESNFYEPGVMAVAAFPNVELAPGEQSRLYIIREADHG